MVFGDLSHPINGATNGSLSLFNVQSNQGGTYFVVISNSYGPTLSSNAALNVVPLLITSQPTDQAASPGDIATFTVTADSSAPLSYQWFFNGTNAISGATNSELTMTNIQYNQLGFYAAHVLNIYGSTNSLKANLSFGIVIPNYTATNQPLGGDSSFSEAFREDDVYAASEFPIYPILIKEIRFRPFLSIFIRFFMLPSPFQFAL